MQAGVELLGLSPGGGGQQLAAKVTIEREGGDKPACVVETVTVLVS